MRNLLPNRFLSSATQNNTTGRGLILDQPTFSRLGESETPAIGTECPFPVGSEVVCLDDSHFPRRAPKEFPLSHYTFPAGFLEKGRTYRVIRTLQHKSGNWGLQLEGLPIRYAHHEITWLATRFTKA